MWPSLVPCFKPKILHTTDQTFTFKVFCAHVPRVLLSVYLSHYESLLCRRSLQPISTAQCFTTTLIADGRFTMREKIRQVARPDCSRPGFHQAVEFCIGQAQACQKRSLPNQTVEAEALRRVTKQLAQSEFEDVLIRPSLKFQIKSDAVLSPSNARDISPSSHAVWWEPTSQEIQASS